MFYVNIIRRKKYFKISWHICHSRLAIKMSFHFWPPFLLKIMVELWKMVWRHEMWQKILYANLFKSFFSPFFLQSVMSKTCTCIFKSLPNKRTYAAKVKTLREGHTIWKYFPPVLTKQLFLLSSVKTSGRFFSNFCDLFRKAEL